ncbi:ATP-binding protein [Pseudomonas sp. GB2N2]
MSKEEVRQLGQVFFRADAARSQPASFGLGFAQCKRLVERLGGQLTVRSALQIGRCVTLTLLRREPAKRAAPDAGV